MGRTHWDPIVRSVYIIYSCLTDVCLQAKYVTRFLRPDQGKIDVGFFAHPTLVEAVELKAITGPLSIAAAGESVPSNQRLQA